MFFWHGILLIFCGIFIFFFLTRSHDILQITHFFLLDAMLLIFNTLLAHATLLYNILLTHAVTNMLYFVDPRHFNNILYYINSRHFTNMLYFIDPRYAVKKKKVENLMSVDLMRSRQIGQPWLFENHSFRPILILEYCKEFVGLGTLHKCLRQSLNPVHINAMLTSQFVWAFENRSFWLIYGA